VKLMVSQALLSGAPMRGVWLSAAC
jgi:hypothetical protein